MPSFLSARRCAGIAATVLLSACALAAKPAAEAPLPTVEIPYSKHSLPNGLTVLVHEDHKAPIVAVNVWYHVGSKDEPQGKTGFAHLFEHLMFQGTENHPDEYFAPFERVGATDMNGTTWLDRTNYFETVPNTALDLALWMESDRMGHFVGAITPALLDEQRDVVKNEKRQGENQPYGRVFERIQAASFPLGHPYHWNTIGSMADLDAASLDDVKDWFATYYGAANVTLVIAGDVDTDTVLRKVRDYFGDIPAGPPLTHQGTWIAARTQSTRDTMSDRVAQTRVYRSWNVPPFGTGDSQLLDIAAEVLGGSKVSRLYQRLVQNEQLADSVSVSNGAFEIAGLWTVQVDVKQGVDPARVERVLDEELAAFIKDGPSDDELARARVGYFTGFVRGAERIGGFGGKADLLAQCQVYTGAADCFRQALDDIRKASAETVRAAAARWLAQGDYTLTVTPYPDFETVASTVDRSHGPPETDTFPDLEFPALQRDRLSNDIEIVLAERHDMPLVEVDALFDAGYAADQGRKLGSAGVTVQMLREGTTTLSGRELSARLQRLGADLDTDSSLDSSEASISALNPQIGEALELLADVVRNPAFRDEDFKVLRGRWLARIAQEKTSPTGLALRTLPPLLYGPGHAYAIPFTGSGTEASILALSPADLAAFQRDWLRPDNLRLLVAGDTTMAEIKPQLEASFGDWTAPATPRPVKNVGPAQSPVAARVFLVDRPGAPQSLILAGTIAPPPSAPNHLQLDTANTVFGGSFTSRLNMNLREDKHWAYGAGSFLSSALGPRPLLMYAPVQTDKTAESIREILRETRDYVSTQPATAAEIEKVKQNDVRSLPGSFETTGAVLGAVRAITLRQRPDDYIETLKARIEAQTLSEVRDAARELFQPERMTWVIVGDLSKIEAPIRALDLGPVSIINGDGAAVR